MAKPILLPPAFSGMWRDDPRNALPKERCWNMVDYVPEQLGAWLTERGGWARHSNDLTGVDASATYVPVVSYVPFSGGDQLLAVTDNSQLVKVGAGSATAVSAVSTVPVSHPVLLNDVLILPSGDGSTAPQQYDGTTVAAITGVPNGKYAAVFVNRVWLAGDSSNKDIVYASGPSDGTSWDTSQTYLSVSGDVTGLAALPNVLLVFGKEKTARFRGTTPPPGSDMYVDDPIFQYGCSDARSIAVNGSYCCFANPTGVYLSNGTAAPTDLTLATGMKKYWRDLLASYSSTWTLAGGWFGQLYVISIMDGSTFKDCIVFDYRKSSAYRLSNVSARMFAAANLAGQELYWGSRSETYVEKLSTIFTPGSSYKNDGDSTAVAGVWESPFYDASLLGSQRWRDAYLVYDLRDAASDSPTFTLGVIKSPEQTSYTSLSPTIAATTKREPVRRRIQQASRGMGFKLTRANASSDARVYALGASVYAREGSRLSP